MFAERVGAQGQFLDCGWQLLCPCESSMANRMVDSVRSVLNQLLPDVYIYTDAAKGGDEGRSVGASQSSTEFALHAH